jgi:hypothetical protein
MTDINYKIIDLFPKALYCTKIDKPLNKQQIKFIEKTELECIKNTGNFSSQNSFILNLKIFKDLKKEITNHVDNFLKNIFFYQNIKPYITQSWLNYTKIKEFHHTHRHPNSFLSGVLYIYTNENDSITLGLEEYECIEPFTSNYNKYNSFFWDYPVKSMELIIFKSSILHKVNIKEENNKRVSLAFNVWLKGDVGNEKSLTKLKL